MHSRLMECICILTRLMGSCTLEDIPFCLLPSNLLYKLYLYAHGILCRIRPMRNGMNRPVSHGKILVSLNYPQIYFAFSLNYPQIPHLVLHQIAFIKYWCPVNIGNILIILVICLISPGLAGGQYNER